MVVRLFLDGREIPINAYNIDIEYIPNFEVIEGMNSFSHVINRNPTIHFSIDMNSTTQELRNLIFSGRNFNVVLEEDNNELHNCHIDSFNENNICGTCFDQRVYNRDIPNNDWMHTEPLGKLKDYKLIKLTKEELKQFLL